MKKIVALILSATTLLSAGLLGSCGKSNDSGKGETINKTVTDAEQHLVDESKLLHRISVKDVGRTFVKNGKTEYKIVIGKSGSEIVKAAAFLAGQIGSCTGAYPELVYDTDGDGVIDGGTEALTWNKQSKYLILAHDAFEKAAGIKWATEDDSSIKLGYSGYMIKSAGESVFFKVNSIYGYQTAVLSFLREVLGYEWFAEDTIVFTNSGETLPDLDIVEKPDFDLNYRSGYVSENGKFATGQTDTELFAYTEGSFVHNSLIYLPPSQYSEEHSSWYSDKWSMYRGEYLPDQLCYTAHGNKAEYDKMIDTATKRVLYYLEQNETACTITFTQQDNFSACDCETCTAAANAFGSISSTYIMFINDLEDKVRAALEEQARENGTEPRKITVLFFAYLATKNAPVYGTSKDNYEVAKNPDNVVTSNGKTYTLPYNKTYANGIVCNENVGCFWAAIGATYNKSFYENTSANQEARESLEKWGLITDKIYAWIYDTNFHKFLYPYNSYDSLVETARCLKDNNADFLFVQAQGTYNELSNQVTPCFGALKTYTAMSVRFYVNMDYGKAVDRFFENYFREAATPMRRYYEKMTNYLRLLEEQYPSVFTGNIYDSFVSEPQYWSISLMKDWLALCDEAYASVEIYKTTNPELYETLVKHIKTETIFPRFVICENYAGYYSAEEITKLRKELYEDCDDLKIGAYSENDALKPYFEKWGVA